MKNVGMYKYVETWELFSHVYRQAFVARNILL